MALAYVQLPRRSTAHIPLLTSRRARSRSSPYPPIASWRSRPIDKAFHMLTFRSWLSLLFASAHFHIPHTISRALHWATYSGSLPAVEFLVRKGADANLADATNHTPLGMPPSLYLRMRDACSPMTLHARKDRGENGSGLLLYQSRQIRGRFTITPAEPSVIARPRLSNLNNDVLGFNQERPKMNRTHCT